MIYGALPRDLGPIDLSPTEMLFWLYCPIKTPGAHLVIPPNLGQFMPIVLRAMREDPERFRDSYVYLTAKTLYVTPASVNRPGWHADGFGTDDLNYVWYDRAPTEFIAGAFKLPDDCAESMRLMTELAIGAQVITYPPKRLLRLTPEVIHRPPVEFEPGLRSFVKVSVSPDRYDLEGNSINHLLGERWALQPRRAERNHPASRGAST